jgi:peptide/nickel transport system permease protein
MHLHMPRYILTRLGQIVITFVLFVILTYVLIESQPGSFAAAFASNPKLTTAQREALARNLGLDRPPAERFVIYLRNLARGDLGLSFTFYPKPVTEVLLERAPRTLTLFLTSTILSFAVGFVAGKVLAWRRGKAIEYGATVGGVMLYTVFTPWFGLMMLWLFAYQLKLFPVGKFVTPEVWRSAPVDANTVFIQMLATVVLASAVIFAAYWLTRRWAARQRSLTRWGVACVVVALAVGYWAASGLAPYALNIAHHLVLPVLTLVLINFAGTMLLTRNSMLETLREDYITTARAKGLPERVIRDKHAARNAMLPVATSFVFALAFAIGGGVITETIFSWPGMGQTLLQAATTKDIPTTMGALIFIAVLALVAHLVADLLYAVLDPRIRYA